MSRIHCPELSVQVPLADKEECHAPHDGMNDMQQNGKHLNQQERDLELVSFLVLGIKTIVRRGSNCKRQIHSPQVLLRIHI